MRNGRLKELPMRSTVGTSRMKDLARASSIVLLLAAWPPRASVAVPGVEDDARAFMAAYADDLKAARREALAGRYHPDGAYHSMGAEQVLYTPEQMRALYAD